MNYHANFNFFFITPCWQANCSFITPHQSEKQFNILMISYFKHWILNFEWKKSKKLLNNWNERNVFIFIHIYYYFFFLQGGGSRFTSGSKIMLTLLNSLISKRPFHLGIKLKWNMSNLRFFNAGFHKSIACILSHAAPVYE